MVVMQTSEAPSVVGLALGTGMVDSCEVGVGRRHSGDLAPKLAELMAKNGVSIDDIGSVAVSRGPGGYTGLRVGLASALALTLIKDADLLAVPTLEAMAWQCPRLHCRLNSLETSERTAKSTTGHTNSICTEQESICPNNLLKCHRFCQRVM